METSFWKIKRSLSLIMTFPTMTFNNATENKVHAINTLSKSVLAENSNYAQQIVSQICAFFSS